MNNTIFNLKLLERKLLLKKISQIEQVPFMYITAPMGYGKTTAVRNYINSKSKVKNIWFSINEFEDDSKLIWSKFVKTIAVYNKKLGDKLYSNGFPESNMDIYRIVEDIKEAVKETCILIIDDYQNMELEGDVFYKMLSMVSKTNIKNLHIIVISRKYPLDYFIELESKQKCVILYEKDFRISQEEVKRFFSINGFQ